MSKYILVFVFFSSIKYSHPTNSFADIICEKTSWYSHEIEMFALDKTEALKALIISYDPSVFIGYSRGSSNKDVINNNQNFTCYKMETNINNFNVCCVTNLDINVDNGEIKADQSRNKNETKPHSNVIFKLVNCKHVLSCNKLEDNLRINKKYYGNFKRRLKRNAQDIYNDKYAHLHTTYFDTTVEPVNGLSATENTITDFDITTDASVIKETNPTEDNDSTVASETKDSTSYSELDPSTNLYSSESTDPSIATDIDTTTQQLEYTDIDSITYSPTDADPSTSSETDSPAYSQSTYDSTDGDLTQEPSTVNPTTVISDDDDDDDGDGDYKGRVSWSPWTIGLVVFASTVVVSILAVSAYHLGKISERSKEFFSEDLEPPNIVVIPRARLNRY